MLVSAAIVSVVAVPAWWSGGGRRRRAPGGLAVGGGRRGRRSGRRGALRPRRREEEGAVVGVLVQVGVGPSGLGCVGRRDWIRAAGRSRQLVFELLHLAGQPLHRVGVVR